MIRVTLRFDDPSVTSDHAVERQIIAELERAGFRATFAVVPFRAEEEGMRRLERGAVPHLLEAQRKGVIEIALHGHSHTCLPGCAHGQSSEFVGLGVGDQEALIREGRRHLEETFETGVDGFVPPWNSADHVTLEALENLGFRYCSSDITTAPRYQGSIRRIPRTCQLRTAVPAIEEALSLRMLGPVVVIVFHHYDFNTKGCFGFERFQQFLQRMSEDPHIQVMTLAEISKIFSPPHSARALRQFEIKARFHWRLQRYLPSYCLVPSHLWFVFFSKFMADVGRWGSYTKPPKSSRV